MQNSFDYAIFRIVPAPERDEFFNAGVVLFCPEQRFLDCRIHVDSGRAAAFNVDTAGVNARVHALLQICAGNPDAGPIAQLSQRARFHWLVSPRSTVLQVSPSHSGLCGDPAAKLNQLFHEQVLIGVDSLDAVLDQLCEREPIFHVPEHPTQMADDYWEIGASGRRYDREFVEKLLANGHGKPARELGWIARDFGIRCLGAHTYLLTYTLEQGPRITLRATIWQRTTTGWCVLYHQGTVLSGAGLHLP